jgi:GT2 family glycosyltransferase
LPIFSAMNAILVLGMHRSGTSALTRLLNLLGCELGTQLLPAAEDNETGFWEHQGVVLLDDEVLALAGRTWDDPRPIAWERLDGSRLAELRARARATLERDFGSASLWALKDPRLCRLMPFWNPVLAEMNATARCVIALRHPAEVARSLRVRNGMSRTRAERLWLSYTLEAERATRRLARTFVTYDQIVDDWRTHLPRIARDLGVFDDDAIRRATGEIAKFVRAELRHHRDENAPNDAWELLAPAAEGRTPDAERLDALAVRHASDAARQPEHLASIVIVTRNGVEHTRRCLDSVARCTRTPHEVIVVDNGSTDGTRRELEARASKAPGLRLVWNADNRGFAAANNQGLAIARGDVLVALNNDVIVTDGWLERLVAVLEEHPNAGIVGPTTNRASGPQVVPVGYTTLSEMEAHAREVSRGHAGESVEARRLVAFCWAMRRSLVDRIGGFDERFETGNCEDDDFCLRAAQAGYRMRIARDCFVHHEGSATFRAENVDYAALLTKNFERFKTKWEMDPAARPEDGYSFVELAAKADRPRVPLPDPAAVGNAHAPPHPAERRAASRLQAGILPGHEAVPRLRAFFARCGHAQLVPHWASAAALDDELRRADFALVLGGDVHMTEDALRTLAAILRTHERAAAVGPVSNAAPPAQRVSPEYRDLDRELRRFAEKVRRKHGDALRAVPAIAPFAALIRGEAVRAVGGLRRELPIAESILDFCNRAQAEGLQVACAPGVYVHHAKWTEDEGSSLDFSRAGELPSLESAARELI